MDWRSTILDEDEIRHPIYGSSEPPFEYTYVIYNYLDVPITVVPRIGAPYKLRPLGGMRREVVVQYRCRYHTQRVDIDPRYDYYNSGRMSQEAKLMRRHIEEGASNDRAPHLIRQFSIEYRINKKDLINPESANYFPQLDLTINIAGNPEQDFHPNNHPEGYVESNEEVKIDEGTYFRLLINDDPSSTQKRYAYIAGEVQEVPITSTQRLQIGVHVWRSRGAGFPIEHQHISLAEAERRFGLYKTREEAQSLGAPESYYKERTQAYKNEELRHKQEELALRRELQQLQYRHDRLKAINAVSERIHQVSQQQTQLWNDVVKMLGAAATLLVAIAKAAEKVQSEGGKS